MVPARRAILVAAVVFAAVAAALLAGASAGILDPPDSIRIVAPKPGDGATYAVSIHRFDDDWAAVPYMVTGVEATWDAPGELRLRADYSFWRIDPPYDSAVFQEIHYGPDEHVVVNSENHPQAVPGDGGVSAPVVTIGQGGTTWADRWFRVAWYQDAAPPCGFRPTFAERPAALEATVVPGGHCGLDATSDPRFRFAGTEEVRGIETYRLDAIDDPQVSLWYNPGIPFPVQAQDHFSALFDPAKTNGHVFRFTLDGFTAGPDARAPTGPSAPPAPPAAVGVVPYDGRVPDDAGVDHPFPLSAAWAFLEANDADFAGYLERHTDAYIGEGIHAFFEDELGRASWRWIVIVTDGHTHFDRIVWYRPGLPADQVDSDPRPAALSASWESVDTGLPHDVTGLYPPPAMVPDTQPDLAEALARATEVYGEPANAWTVRNMCTFGDCDRLRLWFDVGVERVGENADSIPTVAGVIEPPPSFLRLLRFAPDGTVMLTHESTTEPAWSDILGGSAWDPSSASAVRGTYDVPVGSALATAGIAAAIVGALAAWWSPLKATLLGGFSRVTKARALDNPARSRIHDAILADPGIHFQELMRRTGAAQGALEHHLRKLTDTGLVQASAQGGYTCYFPPGQVDRRVQAAMGALKARAARRIFEHLVASGPTKPRAIAEALSISPGTVSHHLKRLKEAGAVEGGGREPYQVALHAFALGAAGA